LKIGFFQFSPYHGKKDKNIEKIIDIIKKSKAELLVFPELATSGYLIPDKNFLKKNAFSVPESKEFEKLFEVVKRTGTGIVLGFPEKFRSKFYNSALYILPDGKFGVYRKIHLFYKEKLFFEKGKNPDSGIFEYRGFKFGIIICFDWFFPEHIRYLAIKKEVHMILHPANLVLPWGQRAMRIRAIENRIFTLTCNRTGEEKNGKEHYRFTGKSQIVTPQGKIIARATSKNESLRVVKIDLKKAEDKALNKYNIISEDIKNFYPYKF